MLNFTTESWLSDFTEILTTKGWLNIKDIYLGAKVLTQVNGIFKEDTIYSIGRGKINSKVKVYNEFLLSKNIIGLEGKEKIPYQGGLHNFRTKYNKLIIRGYKVVEDIKIHDDYLIIDLI